MAFVATHRADAAMPPNQAPDAGDCQLLAPLVASANQTEDREHQALFDVAPVPAHTTTLPCHFGAIFGERGSHFIGKTVLCKPVAGGKKAFEKGVATHLLVNLCQKQKKKRNPLHR